MEIAKIDNRGNMAKKSKVAYDDFVKGYSSTNAKIEIIDNWEAKCISTACESYTEGLAKSYIRLAVRALAADVGEPKVRVQLKPYKGVFVESAFAKDKLILIPETSKVIVAKEAPTNGLKIESPIDLADKSIFLTPTFNVKETVVPSWLVRAVNNEKDANIGISKKSVSITIVVGAKKTERKVDIKVPVLVNTVALKAQDELFIYRAPAAKKRSLLAVASTLKAPKLD